MSSTNGHELLIFRDAGCENSDNYTATRVGAESAGWETTTVDNDPMRAYKQLTSNIGALVVITNESLYLPRHFGAPQSSLPFTTGKMMWMVSKNISLPQTIVTESPDEKLPKGVNAEVIVPSQKRAEGSSLVISIRGWLEELVKLPEPVAHDEHRQKQVETTGRPATNQA